LTDRHLAASRDLHLQSTAPEFHAEDAEETARTRRTACSSREPCTGAPLLSIHDPNNVLMGRGSDLSAPLRVLRGPRREVAYVGTPLRALRVKSLARHA